MSNLLRLILGTAFLGLVQGAALPSARNNWQPEKVKYYTLTLTQGPTSPAGVSRSAILINGQTPGPLIEMEEGQTLSINVINQLNDDATFHLHGMLRELP